MPTPPADAILSRRMPQEHVDFVKTMFAASSGMDKQALLAVLPEFIEQTCDPEIQWIEDPQRADGRIYRGHEGVRESFEQWLDQWEEWGFELERVEDCGDSVLAIAREHGRGTTSGAAVSARNFMVFTFRDGKILRYQEFYDEAEAREATGVSEEAMSRENVEKLLEIYELLNTRFVALKRGDLDELLAFFHPEVVIEMVDAPDPETYHGHDGVRTWFNDAFGPWAAVHIEAEDIKVMGEWTVALLQTSLRGEASGVELELSTAALHQFRGGRIVLDRVYLDRNEGLEALALKA